MEDIKAQVKEVAKKFAKDYVSEVVKESTKKLIKGLVDTKKKAIEAELKNRSVEEIERYFVTKAEFNTAFESTVNSIKEASLEKIQASFEKSFSKYITPQPPTFIEQVLQWIKNPLHAGIISVITITTVIALIVITSPPPAPYPDDGVTDWSSDNTPTFSWSPPSHMISIVSYYYRVDTGSETETTLTSVNLPPQPDGTHNFSVRAKDNAGNSGAYGSHEFKTDTTDPTGSITINNRAPYTTTTSVALSLSYSDSGSGVDQVRYSNDGTWDSEPWEAVASSRSWTLTGGDGSKTVYYQVKDRAGRSSQTYSDTIILDTTRPPAPSPDDKVTGWSRYTTTTFTWSPSSDISGIAGYYYQVDSGSEINTNSTSATLNQQRDGTHNFSVRAVDNAGNIGAYGSHEFKIDTINPPAPSPDDDVTGWSRYNNLTFRWSAQSDTSGISGYYYRVDSGSEINTTSTSATLNQQRDGTHNFSVRAVDNAGNIGAYGSHEFKIDTTDPTGSITINNGATYTTSTSASLSLSYSDSGSGVDLVRYSNDGTWDTEPWEAPAISKSWTLTGGDGTKTVYYQIKDKAGRVTQSYYDTIILDTTPPTITSRTPPSGGGWSIYKAITVTFNKVMNQASAERAFSTSPVTRGSFSWSGNTMIYTPNPSLAYSTTYTVTVGTGAKDLAGNSLQLPYSWQFTTEPKPPAVVFDFISQAPLANWYSGAGQLPWDGSEVDRAGFVKWREYYDLEDGSMPARVLQTHPQWVDYGYIEGIYKLPEPIKAGDRFKAKVGFLKGAGGEVTFEVSYYWGNPDTPGSGLRSVATKIDSGSDGLLRTIDADLTSAAGVKNIYLEVDAGPSSGQDWAVWVEAYIERP